MSTSLNDASARSAPMTIALDPASPTAGGIDDLTDSAHGAGVAPMSMQCAAKRPYAARSSAPSPRSASIMRRGAGFTVTSA
jgi:hypothetical protein